MLSAEISAFVEAKDKREYLITRDEKLFDQLPELIGHRGHECDSRQGALRRGRRWAVPQGDRASTTSRTLKRRIRGLRFVTLAVYASAYRRLIPSNKDTI